MNSIVKDMLDSYYLNVERMLRAALRLWALDRLEVEIHIKDPRTQHTTVYAPCKYLTETGRD